MEVRNKIWEEFKQAKANVVCIRRCEEDSRLSAFSSKHPSTP